MKSIVRSIVAIALFFSLSACDFLEVETVGRTTMPTFFSDVDGLRAGLSGSYSQMYSYYSSEFYKYPELAGNMVELDIVMDEAQMADQFNFTSNPDQETGAVGYIWRKVLEALANVNNVLEYAPPLKTKFPNQVKTIENVQAQALFLRALCHFDLFRVYAQPYNYTADASHLGIPVLTVTPGPDDLPARVSAKGVFEQILKDLHEAETLFGDQPQKGDGYHVSLYAVWGLLSRVYLYMEDWDKAIVYATKVTDDISLAVGDDYLKMYNGLEVGKETLFRLNGTLKSVSLGKFYSSQDAPVSVADTLAKLFDDPNDIRLQLFQLNGEGKPSLFLKYRIGVDYTPEQERYDPFILRVSEMVLNRAEAYVRKGSLTEAANDLKMLIARATDRALSEVVLNYSDKEELLRLVKKERAKELCLEGHQFFDIVRYKEDLVRGHNTKSVVTRLSYPNDLFVLPIPQTELNANVNMVGNPTVNN